MDKSLGNIRKWIGIQNSSISNTALITYMIFIFTLVSMGFLSIIYNEFLLLFLPFAILLVYQTVLDFRKVFYLLLISIPLSTEFYFSSSLMTDLPTEPLIVGLMIVYLIYTLGNGKSIDKKFLSHPITLIILIHLIWIIFTTVFSQLFIVSLKFLLAKIWYIIVFFFLAGGILKKEKDFKIMFWLIFIPFFLVLCFTMLKHAMIGFSFADVNSVMMPFFRNHVVYAAITAVFIPFIIVATTWYNWRSIIKWFLIFNVFFFLAVVYFSYTRTAYIALAIAFGAYFVIRWKLVKWVLLAASILLVFGTYHILNHNKYLDYAPDFEKAVSHKNFDNLVSATAKGQDVSTMERVYRWVAGYHMSKKDIWTGHGPGNFYNFYKKYTVTSFETYVSDNPERSGIHCYYLMMLTDQGIPGALIFIFFTFFVLIYGEKVYHECSSPTRKHMIMGVLICQIIIDAFLIINDMVETDKIGSFFFINLAILINFDLIERNKKSLNNENSRSSN